MKKLLEASPDFLTVSDIEDNTPHQRVLGVEPHDRDLFFLTVQEP